jgi:uncharacterized protein YdhG (YjbR/CyaY superfamily)
MKKAPKDVDGHIERAPEEMQGKLIELRVAIKEVAPDAVERIGHGTPYYGCRGRLI